MYMYAVLDFQEKSWGQLAPKFSLWSPKRFDKSLEGLHKPLERLGKMLER